MTVLAALRGAAPYIGISVPSSVFGSDSREHIELAEVANEAAEDILEANDWQGLKVLYQFTGDGTTAAIPLPTDYLRIPKDQRLWSSEQETPMHHVLSHDEWLELEVKSYELVIRAWTIIGDQIEFKPIIPADEVVSFYYQSKNFARDTDQTAISEFTADTDVFRLPNRLLKLAVIWRWKAGKGLDYAEDMTNYEIALGKAVRADKGPRNLAIGRGTYPRGVDIAYPQAIRP